MDGRNEMWVGQEVERKKEGGGSSRWMEREIERDGLKKKKKPKRENRSSQLEILGLQCWQREPVLAQGWNTNRVKHARENCIKTTHGKGLLYLLGSLYSSLFCTDVCSVTF